MHLRTVTYVFVWIPNRFTRLHYVKETRDTQGYHTLIILVNKSDILFVMNKILTFPSSRAVNLNPILLIFCDFRILPSNKRRYTNLVFATFQLKFAGTDKCDREYFQFDIILRENDT